MILTRLFKLNTNHLTNNNAIHDNSVKEGLWLRPYIYLQVLLKLLSPLQTKSIAYFCTDVLYLKVVCKVLQVFYEDGGLIYDSMSTAICLDNFTSGEGGVWKK